MEVPFMDLDPDTGFLAKLSRIFKKN